MNTATAYAAVPPHELERLQEELEQLRAENQRLASLAYRDPLTGLRNRRCFSERLDEELRRMRRHGEGSLSLLLIDLNGFKRLNDTRGHAAGDAALIAVGRTLEAMVRTEDLVCRLGGDEFAVLLPGTDLAGAEDVEER
ncbi:MAG: GGDEF domain-containing protein, partial [Myxococcota bacterium]